MTATTTNPTPVSARHNPFAVQRTDAVPFDFSETSFVDIVEFYQHVKEHKFRGAIVGKHGRGKTTLLSDLSSLMRDRDIDCELVFFPRERQRQQEVIEEVIHRGACGAIIFVDGLERLPFLSRQRVVRQSKAFGGFIATTHWPGRLKTLIRCRTSEQTVEAVLKSLRIDQPSITLAAKQRFLTRRGNVRLVLRDLYDQYADGQIKSVDAITQSVL